MVSPCATGLRWVKGDHELAWWVYRVGGEVEGEAAEACPSRYGRVRGPRAKMVEGYLGRLNEVVPEIHGEVGMGRRESGDEVVFFPYGYTAPLQACGGLRVGQIELEESRPEKTGGESPRSRCP